jgi:hypothetical protein
VGDKNDQQFSQYGSSIGGMDLVLSEDGQFARRTSSESANLLEDESNSEILNTANASGFISKLSTGEIQFKLQATMTRPDGTVYIGRAKTQIPSSFLKKLGSQKIQHAKWRSPAAKVSGKIPANFGKLSPARQLELAKKLALVDGDFSGLQVDCYIEKVDYK